MSWACDTLRDAAPEQLGTSTTPNWRCWFEAEPMGKGKAKAPGFCSRASRTWIAEGFWEAFWGAFILTPLPEHQATAANLQHPTRRQLEALDIEGAAHSQPWRLHLPTLEVSLA